MTISPKNINVNGENVVIGLMDDAWTFNKCVSEAPFKAQQGAVWTHCDHCARLPGVPGDELPCFMHEIKEKYGNCAALVWHNDILLGHLVFLPKIVARQRRATACEYFSIDSLDQKTLVVINLGFCSLGGQEFRRKGIGTALVNMMVEWAIVNGWKRIEVYDTTGGLFPADWLDSCIPPKPFWEGLGFKVFTKRGIGRFTDEYLWDIMQDNPRKSESEQAIKTDIMTKLKQGLIDQDLYAYQYDLRLADLQLREIQAWSGAASCKRP